MRDAVGGKISRRRTGDIFHIKQLAPNHRHIEQLTDTNNAVDSFAHQIDGPVVHAQRDGNIWKLTMKIRKRSVRTPQTRQEHQCGAFPGVGLITANDSVGQIQIGNQPHGILIIFLSFRGDGKRAGCPMQ
jgi:hypothetical protein